MDSEYSVAVYRKLKDAFEKAALHRPMRVERYEQGDELTYAVTSVVGANRGSIRLVIEDFVGGGFAGQVYRVKVLDLGASSGPIGGLEVGGVYALKLFIPPTTFSQLFRNTLYWIGFQGPFQIQVNPTAARSGALWQKFIRRAAKIRFGDERAVVDIHATLVDTRLGSCGEVSEWIAGRTWLLEVDEHLELLKEWKKHRDGGLCNLGSPEYRAKYLFMHEFVELLHTMGCYEFARQYEWSTCKSQPNCLKRYDTEESPSEGLVAVDFRAGLTLLPFLPMSPGDVKLIGKGLSRGSLVQFDRGDTEKLDQFVTANSGEFTDIYPMLEELKATEQVYRNSIPDITHNHIRLLYSPRLWRTMLDSAVTGWKVRNLIDEQHEEKLRNSTMLVLLLCLIGFPPIIGTFFMRIWGQPCWRKHYASIVTSWSYFLQAFRARAMEKIIRWHRAGRFDDEHALKAAGQLWRLAYHVPFSLLPAGLHRFFTDGHYARDILDYLVRRPVRLYFNEALREQWLRDMVGEGKKKHLLSDEDARGILSNIKDSFIQKYLKSLAVHVCTLPVTQIVSVIVAIVYVLMHPDMPRGKAYGIGLGIIALFQVLPISPGSLVRGFYVVYLVVRERNFKDYNIAVFLGFFKYIGYLAFPIQMTYRYPALARFMAAHWATDAVHIVPVFGERGALLEHGVFSLFYNRPLTIRRRMKKRSEMRALLPPRYWHIVLCAISGAGILGIGDAFYLRYVGNLPGLVEIWWLALLVPVFCGTLVTLGAGGAVMWKRVTGGAGCGVILGVLYTALPVILGYSVDMGIGTLALNGAWRIFIFTLLSTAGVLLTEIGLPESESIVGERGS
jgi:hypothetical protein